jgi:DNA transposition AAA+ family ATPase
MNLREQTVVYMKAHHLSRREMAERVDVKSSNLAKFLDNMPGCAKEMIEAALQAYFLKLERVQARAPRPEFIETMTAKIILEKCQEADEKRELALLYGPAGMGKTFAIEEFIDRIEKQASPDKPEALYVTAHSASTAKSLMAALCLQAGIPQRGTAAALAENLVRKLEGRHTLIMVDESNHLDIEAMELLRFIYDKGRLGVVLIGTLRLYDIFTDGSRPASELEQLWSRVGICELLPGLTEYEARQIVQRELGRLPEPTIKQILHQAGNSMRRLTKLLERLKELKELNNDHELDELITVSGNGLSASSR